MMQGYIKRQAIYSCMTCVPESRNDPSKRAGICLACSLTCHESHDLIELYTKRHFRCDCGNAKMTAVRCLLEPIKFGINEENKYNHNFSGKYCTCARPYPDPEDTVIDEMIQCSSCEDWFHGRHLNSKKPNNYEDYAEMICGQCMDRLPFLSHYLEHSLKLDIEAESSIVDVDETTEAEDPPAKKLKTEEGEGSTSTTSELCMKPKPPGDRKPGSAVYWLEDWRSKLCKCETCTQNYKELAVEYLLDPEDTVARYEEAGRKRCAKNGTGSNRDVMNEALSTLGHVQQVDLITQYNKFKDRLKEFLAAFAQNNQVVTQEDITRFFEQMKDEKKQAQGLPYFCR